MLKRSDRVQKYGFGRSTAQKAVSSANKHYATWSSEHNINNIKTLADYYNVKYNDSERYALLQGYVKAVNKGDISPLIGFDLYESKAKEIKDELVGLKISNDLNYEITDLDERIKITGKSCSFVYSVKDKLLVQAISFGEDIIL